MIAEIRRKVPQSKYPSNCPLFSDWVSVVFPRNGFTRLRHALKTSKFTGLLGSADESFTNIQTLQGSSNQRVGEHST